ncbi:hypothetical protein [Nonomuraea roseoviolacea]|jgi:hypothetical protein|uniref:Uncharacterized protein n=1 Tax=Nonomuraea roseoviolacea subsp. carminata TaxID=160689 RepID=A0ABT1KIA8_9ACTN|nr:hypothetical protein [Nonomuraea roseoviolacea]MCP2352699.1 hypothetical protein [Nonomuraea roseoviolacea subsp. carminata]
MKLTFLGKETTGDQSPTLYATDRGTIVVQGWKITDREALETLKDVPDHETFLEVPRELMRHLPKEWLEHGDAAPNP